MRLTLRRLPLPSCAAQQAVLLSASLSAAAYLSAASVYGLVFLPLICVAQGLVLGHAAQEVLRAATSVEGISWRYALFFLLQLPTLFFLAQRGFAIAAYLADQKLGAQERARTKEFFLLTGLLLVSVFATYLCCC